MAEIFGDDKPVIIGVVRHLMKMGYEPKIKYDREKLREFCNKIDVIYSHIPIRFSFGVAISTDFMRLEQKIKRVIL